MISRCVTELAGSTLTFAAVLALTATPALGRPPGGNGNGGGGGGGGGGGNEPPADPAIAYTDRDGIYVMDADGANQTRLFRTRDTVRFPAWSPDGSQIVFCGNPDGQAGLYVMNADGSNVRMVTPLAGALSNFEWSPAPAPDGQYKIAFHEYTQTGSYDLFIVNLDGSGRINLTNSSPDAEFCATWSPEADRIAVTTGFSDITIFDLGQVDGQVAIVNETTVFTGSAAFPRWSNSGDFIAFSSQLGSGTYDIVVLDLRDLTLSAVTTTPDEDERWATFSPDDSRLMFHRTGGTRGIYVIDITGANEAYMNTKGFDPHWRRY